MKSLRLAAVLSLMWGVALVVPASTEAADRGHNGSRGYANNRQGNRGGGQGHGYSHGSRSYRNGGSYGHGRSYNYNHGRSYRYGSRYYGYRRPYYAPSFSFSYGYDPYYYDDYGYYAQPPAYYAPPPYYVRPYVRRPRVGLYFGY